MNNFTRIALAAGLLAAPALPAFAQNGTPLTGTTSPTPSTQPALSTPATAAPKATTTHHATTTPKTHHMAKATTKKPATPVSVPASQTPPVTTKSP